LGASQWPIIIGAAQKNHSVVVAVVVVVAAVLLLPVHSLIISVRVVTLAAAAKEYKAGQHRQAELRLTSSSSTQNKSSKK
jgi:hypothetical protein